MTLCQLWRFFFFFFSNRNEGKTKVCAHISITFNQKASQNVAWESVLLPHWNSKVSLQHTWMKHQTELLEKKMNLIVIIVQHTKSLDLVLHPWWSWRKPFPGFSIANFWWRSCLGRIANAVWLNVMVPKACTKVHQNPAWSSKKENAEKGCHINESLPWLGINGFPYTTA